MDIQPQWSLDATSSSVYSIARGVLRAATSDNVQPLAILACERFGNTVAMSQETCRKIEKFVLPTPPSAPVQFLRGVVGFSAHDCATQLGSSMAGVYFLSLAAALVTTMSVFRAAEAVEKMLRQTATDKTLLPTIRQLRDLLASLEPRSHSAGFADSVMGWRLLLYETAGFSSEARRSFAFAPSPERTETVVDAFRQLSRIGDTTVVRVTIKTTKCAPWLAAFTKWCLGVPPSVYLHDGRAVIEQPDSLVDIITYSDLEDERDAFELTIDHTVGQLNHLALLDNGEMLKCMVTPSLYGKWLLLERDLGSGQAFRAFRQAIPFVLSETLSKLFFSGYFRFDERMSLSEWRLACSAGKVLHIDEDLLALRLSPFPEKIVIGKALSLILRTDKIDTLPTLPPGLQITDLPVVKHFMKVLEKECDCAHCFKDTGSDTDTSYDFRTFRTCSKESFLQHLSTAVADILALSLFQEPEFLLIQSNALKHYGHPFPRAIYEIMNSGSPRICDIFRLMDWALALVGHEVETNVTSEEWIMSSFKGQTVYPTIFDSKKIQRNGYLCLTWLRGILRHNDETYSRVVSSSESSSGKSPLSGKVLPDVKQPVNLTPSFKMVWRVSHGDGVLKAVLGVDSPFGGENDRMGNRPTTIWNNLAGSLILEDCAHPDDSPLNATDQFCRYTSFMRPLVNFRSDEPCVVGVVAVDGADDLRLLSLSKYDKTPVVIRGKACLSCCLQVCRKSNAPILLL